jgi:hypothetical protein
VTGDANFELAPERALGRRNSSLVRGVRQSALLRRRACDGEQKHSSTPPWSPARSRDVYSASELLEYMESEFQLPARHIART